MTIIVLWLIFCGVAALIASSKGRSGLLFFILALPFPLIAILIAAVLSDKKVRKVMIVEAPAQMDGGVRVRHVTGYEAEKDEAMLARFSQD
jgi:hypothetical protein